MLAVVIRTVGYEGAEIGAFVARLVGEGIGCLIDVRANAISRKVGFSKTRLRQSCEDVGIGYVHLRGLGIPSAERKRVGVDLTLAQLFDNYRRSLVAPREEPERGECPAPGLAEDGAGWGEAGWVSGRWGA